MLKIKKACIVCNGCNRRALDARFIHDYLDLNSIDLVSAGPDADIIFFISCAFKQSRARQSMQIIKDLCQHKAQVVVLGCLPEIFSQETKALAQSLEFKVLKTEQIESLFPDFRFSTSKVCEPNFPLRSTADDQNLEVPTIMVARGCIGKCTYCGIKKAIGPLKSKPLEQCMREYQNLLALGYEKIILDADDLGAYGLDCGQRLDTLLWSLEQSSKEAGRVKWRIAEISPGFALRYQDILIYLFEKHRITAFNCNIQSGSQSILKGMQRSTDINSIFSFFKKIQNISNKVFLSSQFIFGFPGESQKDFYQTLELVQDLKLATSTFFPFSAVPNALASTFADQVSQKELQRRSNIIKEYFSSPGFSITTTAHGLNVHYKDRESISLLGGTKKRPESELSS